MGRYPIYYVMAKYLEYRRAYWGRSTYDERRRKLTRLARVICEMADAGTIQTTNPSKMTERDIALFLAELRRRNLEPATQMKALSCLNGMFLFCRNTAIQRLREKHDPVLPSEEPKPIETLSEEQVWAIHEAAGRMRGYPGEVARLISVLYPYTGLRPSELRLTKKVDLDLVGWVLRVESPKGKGVWARKRTVGIPMRVRPAIQEYLTARAERLKAFGLAEAEPLIPRIGEVTAHPECGIVGYYSDMEFRRIKRDMERMAGIPFKLKTYRCTFLRMVMERDPNSLPVASRVMGHASTETTQRHYGRIQAATAAEEVRSLLDQPVLIPQKCHTLD
jgi:integrase